jgi:hypothetical protein
LGLPNQSYGQALASAPFTGTPRAITELPYE